MAPRPRLRKFALTAHVISSVGWLGAVAVFLALSVVGLTSTDGPAVRASYLAMESIGFFVLVPLSIASLISGLVQSFGTKCGLLRHYWVVMKLLITVVATVVLLLYMQTLSHQSDLARELAAAPRDLDELRSFSPVLHAGAGLLLLIGAATLSVYKPQGMTRYGQRKQQPASRAARSRA